MITAVEVHINSIVDFDNTYFTENIFRSNPNKGPDLGMSLGLLNNIGVNIDRAAIVTAYVVDDEEPILHFVQPKVKGDALIALGAGGLITPDFASKILEGTRDFIFTGGYFGVCLMATVREVARALPIDVESKLNFHFPMQLIAGGSNIDLEERYRIRRFFERELRHKVKVYEDGEFVRSHDDDSKATISFHYWSDINMLPKEA